jgi:hypothetical protein
MFDEMLKCHMLEDSENCFELSCVGCICMKTDVRHKKSHNQIGWIWKKVSSLLFFKKILLIVIFHGEVIIKKESNGLTSTLILELYVDVDFIDQFLSISIFTLDQDDYHDKPQSYGRITLFTFKSDMKMLHLKCCNFVRIWSLNPLSSVLKKFAKL